MKRTFDLLCATILLMLFLLPMLVISLLILWVMGRPILYKQKRPGLHGRPFYIYKFRTMTDDVDEKGELLPNEERITRLGRLLRRLSVDELPQLYNVLKGDLSLVGPRPLLMEYLPLYNEEQARRHDVKPGITGWAQVNGRNAISWEERFKLDVWYVEHQSFRLDLKILWLTFIKVFKREHIEPPNQPFIDKFQGSSKK